MRTIYVVVNTEGGVGSVDWRDNFGDLPEYDKYDQVYRVNVPESAADDDAAITDAMDAFLGEYDLPEGWECGPV